ncbi:DUF2188 domain-containing protein [Agaribacter marinus]|uniref:DUF2188 domain-containing protein n=1 Tax=Virgibacillus salarius TaxID=447199 RepID=A0A941DSQ1_9BACI|nr:MULTISPECIES: DUF2188 domain-containing protein [Bacillaceae]MBR7795910.1 DUF2188 domain-containing protein [Virgibacillus salarius]NAZ08622.1 DUF2188 domain-containing protein [Agaribacter marinus]WBX78552.1 DUF2188 domain-containing protein [Virgibacillus salarius]
MKSYTVIPNVDATGWFVKLENVAPEELYDAKDEAIAAAVEMAQENSPSKVTILDRFHNVVEETSY